MTNNENANSVSPGNEKEIKQHANEAGKLMKQDIENNPVKEALKKEISPTSADDLSVIHNTHEVGTSGGDQREPDIEPVKKPLNENDKDDNPFAPQKPLPVEEPETHSKNPQPIYEEPDHQ